MLFLVGVILNKTAMNIHVNFCVCVYVNISVNVSLVNHQKLVDNAEVYV